MSQDAKAWIAGIIERCAHEMMQQDMRALGLDVGLRGFRFNRSIYANMALHFFLAVVATGLLFVQPFVALGLHLLVGVSYWLDSNKRAKILRRLFPFRASQNLVATHPASGALRKRLVFVSHIDAAFTGWIFHPTMIKMATTPPPIKALAFTSKSMLLATLAVFGLAALDAVVGVVGMSWPLAALAALLSITPLLTCALNAQVVLRDTVVPGANDNLSGCWANLELARRLVPDCPPDVELVFVATGCEEAGTGGSWALADDLQDTWERAHTIILGIDSLTNGTLRYFIEGELLTLPPPAHLVEAIAQHAPEVTGFEIPSGATDAQAWLVRGFDAISFGCVDPEIGAPRHYHYPTDNVQNMDTEQLARSVDIVERVARAIMA